MRTWKKGDRVRVKREGQFKHKRAGQTGTVVDVGPTDVLLVRCDEAPKGPDYWHASWFEPEEGPIDLGITDEPDRGALPLGEGLH